METRQFVLTYEPARFEQLAGEIRDIQRELAEIVEEAVSPDELFMVKVDARGDLLALDIDPRVYRDADSATFADAITRTYGARAAADQRAFDLTMRQPDLTSAAAAGR